MTELLHVYDDYTLPQTLNISLNYCPPDGDRRFHKLSNDMTTSMAINCRTMSILRQCPFYRCESQFTLTAELVRLTVINVASIFLSPLRSSRSGTWSWEDIFRCIFWPFARWIVGVLCGCVYWFLLIRCYFLTWLVSTQLLLYNHFDGILPLSDCF